MHLYRNSRCNGNDMGKIYVEIKGGSPDPPCPFLGGAPVVEGPDIPDVRAGTTKEPNDMDELLNAAYSCWVSKPRRGYRILSISQCSCRPSSPFLPLFSA